MAHFNANGQVIVVAEMTTEISKVEMVWNEAQMFAKDIISDAWRGIPWDDLPPDVQDQFAFLVTSDVPISEFLRL